MGQTIDRCIITPTSICTILLLHIPYCHINNDIIIYTRLDSLTRPSMKDLNKHVTPLVATRWYDLGLELLETKHERELDIIETNYENNATKCCRKMFSKWLETQSDNASWDQLIQAVKNIKVNNVASDIEQLLLQGEYVTDLP